MRTVLSYRIIQVEMINDFRFAYSQ